MSDLDPNASVLAGAALAGAAMWRVLAYIVGTQQPRCRSDAELLQAVKDVSRDLQRLAESVDRAGRHAEADHKETHQRLEKIQLVLAAACATKARD